MVILAVIEHPSDSVWVHGIYEQFLIAEPLACPVVAAEYRLLLLERHLMLFNQLSLLDEVHRLRTITEIVDGLVWHCDDLWDHVFI